MDVQTESYFRQALAKLEITETEFDKLYFYELDTENLGGSNKALFWVFMAVAAGLAIYAVMCAVGFFGNGYMKDIQNYLQKDGSVSLAAIEEDFNQARIFEKSVWVGRKWTIYMQGRNAFILANKDLVWGYYFSRTGRNSVSEMRLYTAEKKLYHISLTEKNTQDALKIYLEEQPQMVVGYSKELEKLYNKKFNEFLDLKYNPAKRDISGEELPM